MKLEVLDTKQVDVKTWALCKGNLLQETFSQNIDVAHKEFHIISFSSS